MTLKTCWRTAGRCSRSDVHRSSELIRRHFVDHVRQLTSSSVRVILSTTIDNIFSNCIHLVSAAISVKNKWAGPSWRIIAYRYLRAFSQYGGEPRISFRMRYPSSNLINWSTAFEVPVVLKSHTNEQWVAVIEPRVDYAAGNDSSNVVRKRLAHMAQRAYVEVAGFAHVSHICWSNVRSRSNVTPRVLIVGDGWMAAFKTRL